MKFGKKQLAEILKSSTGPAVILGFAQLVIGLIWSKQTIAADILMVSLGTYAIFVLGYLFLLLVYNISPSFWTALHKYKRKEIKDTPVSGKIIGTLLPDLYELLEMSDISL